ncbi:hypothetical protein C2G38_2232746 [Gigaspora rosea]|uniref:Uncharacterized protein n=1 Tax=Gigaspora rosea TaxID=44941 RepID=A0A397TRQ3_9GLOM|nr:hypothetical protein C2G38_2232746 [Gigaspora rosea]
MNLQKRRVSKRIESKVENNKNKKKETETYQYDKEKAPTPKKNKRQRVPKKTSSTTPTTEMNINNRTTEINDFKPKWSSTIREQHTNDARNENSPQ